MNIAKKLTDLIGNTPLLQLADFAAKRDIKANLLAKVEYFNPGGSVKDRVAYNMILDAEKKGALKPGATIIEPTSGNTGIGLALVSAVRGYHLILTMPETMSIERRKLVKAYGAEVVLTPGAEGMKGAIAKAEQLRDSIEGAVILQQFENPANPAAHYATTAEELFRDTDGKIDVFVSAAGTGGTVSGVGKRLKELIPGIHIVAVEPSTSAVLSGEPAGKHGIQGIGAGFVPKIFNREAVDEIFKVSTEEAIATSRQLAVEEGLLVGISSGSSAFAASEIAKREEYAGKTVIALLPDTGERYLSTALYDFE